MGHTAHNKTRLLNRVKRIRGQVEGLERGLEEGRDCGEVLQLIAAVRGAVNGLMAEVICASTWPVPTLPATSGPGAPTTSPPSCAPTSNNPPERPA